MVDRLGSAFRAECEALDELVRSLPSTSLDERTHFYGWTVRDVLMHLRFLDEVTTRAIEDEAGFLAQLREIRTWQSEGSELSDYMRRYYTVSDSRLLADWRDGFVALADLFDTSHAKARMKWFGPEMSLRSAASARQMEVWAHGQDLYDHFGLSRSVSDRIRNVCELGVRTFGWSFANRGMPVPPSPPRVDLSSPTGETWTWNPQSDCRVSGSAEEFALVVTQRRHVDDTSLICIGAPARTWMTIAQCFAGAPSDGPAPGLQGRIAGPRA